MPFDAKEKIISYDIKSGTRVDFDVELETIHALDSIEHPCYYHGDGNFEKCLTKEVDKLALSKWGCTSPFGYELDKICKNETLGKSVYNEMDELLIEDLDCKRPCSNIIIKADMMEDKNYYTGKESIYMVAYLKFYQRVKVMRNQYAFPLLSLIAEIGGYVGLFMGVGILQTSNLLKMLALKYL